MSDLLLEKIEEDICKWFYCKHKRSLEEGLTLVENYKDIEKMFEVASYHGTIDLYICHTPQVYLVDYYLKNVTVDDSDEEVTSIYRSHENAKKNVDTMSFKELVAWEKEEGESPSVLRSPHVWKNLKDVGNGKGKVPLDDFEAVGKDKENHEWEYFLDIDDSELNLSAPLHLTNNSNFNDAPTQEMDHVDEKSSRIIPGPAALEYINDNREIGGGCFGDIKSYLKKGKLEKVVAIITSCKPNMLGDMNVTLKDPSGTISGIIHHKVLLNNDVAKAIKVGSAIILQNVSVFHWRDPPMCARAVTIIPGLLRRLNNNQETINVQAIQARRLKEMQRELRMTRLLTELCHEVTDATRDKVGLIEEVKQLGVAAQGSDSLAYLRILRDEDLGKARSIMNLIKATQEHTREKCAFIAKVKIARG
ncbi:reverse transcriptase zinc-binding domain-containing protein [Tanacetum coccineum]